MKKSSIPKLIELAAAGLPEAKIIAQIEEDINWIRVVLSSDFFKSLVRIRKNESTRSSNK